MLGVTFKENVPDLRNSKVVDVIRALRQRGHIVDIHDPYADASEALHEYGETLLASLNGRADYDCLVAAVAHQPYVDFTDDVLTELVKPQGLIADVKGMWRNRHMPHDRRVWSL